MGMVFYPAKFREQGNRPQIKQGGDDGWLIQAK